MGNPQLNPDQSNTKAGGIVAIAADDLTGMRSRLVVLGNATGTVIASAIASVSALALYLLDQDGDEDEEVQLSPISAQENFRVVAKGTGGAGAVLALADPATPADKGKVRVVPATEGAYFSPGIAEEDFVDGQLVLVRPFPRLVHVGAAFTGATPADTAATNSSPYGYTQAQANALLATVRELRAWAIANGFKANNA